MLFFKKISVIIITIFVALLIIDRFYQSEVNEILIKDVVINAKENIRYLNFKQEINIDSPIRKAINNGIPLVFKVILKIVKINDILPNKTVSKEIRYYQIEYKALRKVYKIKDINGKKYEYKHIDEAIKKISTVEDFEFSIIDNHINHELWLNVSLERKKLPKPLQVNYFDRTWYMNSNKSIHKL